MCRVAALAVPKDDGCGCPFLPTLVRGESVTATCKHSEIERIDISVKRSINAVSPTRRRETANLPVANGEGASVPRPLVLSGGTVADSEGAPLEGGGRNPLAFIQRYI